MADLDFTLSEGDTAPVLRMQLLMPLDRTDPEFESYPLGKPIDLTGATITVKLRVEDESQPGIAKAAYADPDEDPADGWMIFEWDGYPPGRYLGRIKVLQNNGKQSSYLNDRKFTLVVDADPIAEIIIPPTPPPAVRVGANITLDSIDALATLDVSAYLPGSTFARVRGVVGLFALDAADGSTPDSDRGIYASTDGSLLWFNF